jgi:hypothetical protein
MDIKLVDDDTFKNVNFILSSMLNNTNSNFKYIICELDKRSDLKVHIEDLHSNVFLSDIAPNSSIKNSHGILKNDSCVDEFNNYRQNKKIIKNSSNSRNISDDYVVSPSDYNRVSVGTVSVEYNLSIDDVELIRFYMIHYINNFKLRKVELNFMIVANKEQWSKYTRLNHDIEYYRDIPEFLDNVNIDVSGYNIKYNQDFFYYCMKELPKLFFKPSHLSTGGDISFILGNWVISKFI